MGYCRRAPNPSHPPGRRCRRRRQRRPGEEPLLPYAFSQQTTAPGEASSPVACAEYVPVRSSQTHPDNAIVADRPRLQARQARRWACVECAPVCSSHTGRLARPGAVALCASRHNVPRHATGRLTRPAAVALCASRHNAPRHATGRLARPERWSVGYAGAPRTRHRSAHCAGFPSAGPEAKNRVSVAL